MYFPKSLSNCDNFFGNLSCQPALEQALAVWQRKGLLYEEYIFSNLGKNLYLAFEIA